jgi:hypothetical protein
VVQIHSPRPFFRISNFQVLIGCGASGAVPGARWLKSICHDHSFASQISAVRCVLCCVFNFIWTDNTDNITTSVVLLGCSKPCCRRVTMPNPVSYPRSTDVSEALRLAMKCSQAVERLTAESSSAVGVLYSARKSANRVRGSWL